jgi:hypothetical protein
MKLIELSPQFRKITDTDRTMFCKVETIDEADGISFLCPKCFAENGGAVGTHGVICWRPRVPRDARPGPGRWELEGTGYSDLTLRASSSSVQLTGGCAAHFFVENGEIRMC